jgi:probable HAF family extracellular repeat protein
LGNLGGTQGSNALFINSLGDVAGTSYTGDGYEHTFLFVPGLSDIGTLTDLDDGLPVNSSPKGLNLSGEVSGLQSGSSGLQAFLYNGTLLTNGLSQGFGLNDSGMVVGVSLTNGQAISWNGSTVNPLGKLGGTSSQADFINNAGQIVGISNVGSDNESDAFLLQNGTTLSSTCVSAGTCVDITIGGNATPNALNSNGLVVGEGYTSPGTSSKEQAFLYPGTGTGTQNLGTLDDYGASDALAINNNANYEVVGYSDVSASSGHAFLYAEDPTTHVYSMQDLGSLDGLAYSEAEGINDSGVIVGTAYSSAIPTSAVVGEVPFIYINGTMTDLNDYLPAGSGLILLTATGINNSNEIIGQAEEASTGAIDGYVLTYTETDSSPEPSTMVLTVLGVLLCGFIVHRRALHRE